MNLHPQPYKHVGDEGKPGQIINPINHDMMDDMGRYAGPVLKYTDAKAPGSPLAGQTISGRTVFAAPTAEAVEAAEKLRLEPLTRRGNPFPGTTAQDISKRVTWGDSGYEESAAEFWWRQACEWRRRAMTAENRISLFNAWVLDNAPLLQKSDRLNLRDCKAFKQLIGA